MLCQLKACRKCHGDLVLNGDEWRCWQCGQYYYPKPPILDAPQYSLGSGGALATEGGAVPRRRRSRRAVRDINVVIAAKDRSESRWWKQNREVIRYLDEGRTVREISNVIGRGQRQIRVIRERLNDLRACRMELSAAG